jgi:phosphate-selective porin OprO/OprP
LPIQGIHDALLAAALAGMMTAAVPPSACAQQAEGVSAPPPQVVVRWNDGLSIESNDGDNKLQFGGLIQVDGRFDVNDPTATSTDTFVLRRARPILQGRAGRIFEFRLMPDFGNGTTVLFDAYFDMKLSALARIRAGKDKTPLGYEQLLSDFAVVFPERTLVTNLVPNRDIGVQVRGDVAAGSVSYIGGVFNGVPDGANGDLDTNDSKDLAGRLTFKAGDLGVAIAGTSGRQAGALPSFKTTAQQTFFSYASNAVADGMRTRVSPAVFYYSRAFAAFGEYARTRQAVTAGTVHEDIANCAWEVTALVVATGEKASDRGVVPKKPFNRASGQWGALQLAGRWSSLTIDRQAFALALASHGSSRTAEAVGVSATWYPSVWVKYVLSYERTVFDDNADAPRKPEHAIVFRLQFSLQPGL